MSPRLIAHLDADVDHLARVDGMHDAHDHTFQLETEVEQQGEVGVAVARDEAEFDVALGVDGNGVTIVGITWLTHKTQSITHDELVMDGCVESLRVEVSGYISAEEADASGHEANVRVAATYYVVDRAKLRELVNTIFDLYDTCSTKEHRSNGHLPFFFRGEALARVHQ